MHPTNLTAKTVASIKPEAKRQEIRDGKVSGLFLVVQPSGAKSWALRFRLHGRLLKHTIGPYPGVGLDQARAAAIVAKAEIARGLNPIEAHKTRIREAAPADTVDAVLDDYIARYVRVKLRRSSVYETERLLNKHVRPALAGQPIRNVTKRGVLDITEALSKEGKGTTANRVHAALSTMFNWALDRDIIAASPMPRVKPAGENQRSRFLDNDELELVWKAASADDTQVGRVVRLLILTGQRRGEVGGMRWEEIDTKHRLWVLPASRAKNGHEHHVPLSPEALAVIEQIPRNDSPLVFSSPGSNPIRDYASAKKRIDARIKALPGGEALKPWTLHDLRRSVATGMSRRLKPKIPVTVIEKILNHTSGTFRGVTGVYQQDDFLPEMRGALEAWGRHVVGLGKPGEAAKVIRLDAMA